MPRSASSRRLGEVEWMDMRLLPQRGAPALSSAGTPAMGAAATADADSKRLQPTHPPRRERLQGLDAVRGLNVIVMMFVDDTPFDSLDHAAWDGAYHLADFVMPLFLFMVGVSMAFAMKKYSGPGLKWKVLSRSAKLFVIGLITQGANVFDCQGIDVHGVRIPGILQRIAWAYLVVALMKMYLPVYTADGFLSPKIGCWSNAPHGKFAIFKHYALHWAVAFGFVFVYVSIMLFAKVPSWEYSRPSGWAMDDGELDSDCEETGNKTLGTLIQVCTTEWKKEKTYRTECDDISGDLTPRCSAARMVDEWILGFNHMYDEGCEGCRECNDEAPDWPIGQKKPKWCDARFDPEGVLSSVPTVMTTWLGLHFGQVLTHFSEVGYRLQHWVMLSTVLVLLGIFISIFWSMNKQLWSPSYMFFMAGCSGYLLVAFYLVYDLQLHDTASMQQRALHMSQRGLRFFFTPARWVGLNTMFVYLMGPSGGVFFGLQNWLYFNGNREDTPRELFYKYVFCEHTEKIDHVKICAGYGIFNGTEKSTSKLCWLVFRIAFWVIVAGSVLIHYA